MSHRDAPSLDHLRILAAVVDAGSFSGAARQLDRSQPAISYAIAALEAQLGFSLFERGKRKPTLTPSGAAVLSYAKRMGQLADELAASTASMTAGLEGQIAVALDTFFPESILGAALEDLAGRYPSVGVDIRVRPRELVLREVMEGQVAFGVGTFDIAWPPGIEARDFGRIEIVATASPDHALARHAGPISNGALRDFLQISNRSAGPDDDTRDVSINSSRVWRVSGLSLQLELLRRGLGWGYLPSHVADPELRAGRLVPLDPRTRRRGIQPWSLIFRSAKPLGPAGRLLSERLIHHASSEATCFAGNA
ncbi:MAG: HTH-type transcriptional activator AllS [Pseudomonadota bacterium]|jgi:DNA-binding transcriptional LysR family regulator